MEVTGSILGPVTRVVVVLGDVSLLSKKILGYNIGIGHDSFIRHVYSATILWLLRFTNSH